MYYIYTWKCHNEIPCIGILNKQKCLFFSKKLRAEGKTVPIWDLVPVGGRGYKERVHEGEYAEILYTQVGKWKNETC
jgi:hypothetical protein